MKPISWLLLTSSFLSVNSYAIDVMFYKKQEITRILEINEINKTYAECSDEYMNGRIAKVEGRYPRISIDFKSNSKNITSSAELDLGEMNMVALKALDTIIFTGSRVKAYIQRCGSGGLPYLIYIKKLNIN